MEIQQLKNVSKKVDSDASLPTSKSQEKIAGQLGWGRDPNHCLKVETVATASLPKAGGLSALPRPFSIRNRFLELRFPRPIPVFDCQSSTIGQGQNFQAQHRPAIRLKRCSRITAQCDQPPTQRQHRCAPAHTDAGHAGPTAAVNLCTDNFCTGEGASRPATNGDPSPFLVAA